MASTINDPLGKQTMEHNENIKEMNNINLIPYFLKIISNILINFFLLNY